MKSLVDFIILVFLKSVIPSCENTPHNLLFINTGQIGDLIVSSALFESDELFSEYDNVYFLMIKENRILFNDYNGRIKIRTIELEFYKYNLVYRIRYNSQLKKLNINTVYNITSLRTTWNDTLALGVGASEIYSYENSWNSLQKIFSKRTDAYYTKQVVVGLFNEYDRIEKVVRIFTKNKTALIKCTTNVFPIKNGNNRNPIIIAPFSLEGNKDIKVNDINKLIYKFRHLDFMILCSEEQKSKLKRLSNPGNLSIAAGKYRLNQLIPVIGQAKIFIGVDSGLTHLALKTNVQVIAIIGMGNYGRYLPKPNDNKTVYLFDECEYAGCEWNCKKEEVLCVENITEEKIINEISNMLRNYENS